MLQLLNNFLEYAAPKTATTPLKVDFYDPAIVAESTKLGEDLSLLFQQERSKRNDANYGTFSSATNKP